MTSLKIAALLALICVALGATARKGGNDVIQTKSNATRCFPDEYEGNLWQGIASYDEASKQPGFVEQFMKYSRSFPKKMGAASGQSGETKFRVIQDFNKLIQYTISDGECYKAPLTADMGVQCLPDSYKFVGNFYQGAGDHKLSLNAFSINIEHVMHGTMSLSEDGVIIGNYETLKNNGMDLFITQGFSNVVLKVADPSVFVVPDICNKAKEMKGTMAKMATLFMHKQ